MGIGRPFKPGNTEGKGRPPGSRNRIKFFQEVLDKDGERIIETIIRRALRSNPAAMKLCMERLLPVAKTPNPEFFLPPVETVSALTGATSAVIQAVTEGELSSPEGEAVARMIDGQRKNLEISEIDGRLRVLEEEARKRL